MHEQPHAFNIIINGVKYVGCSLNEPGRLLLSAMDFWKCPQCGKSEEEIERGSINTHFTHHDCCSMFGKIKHIYS